MDKENNVKIITLKDLWGIFVHRLWVIFLITAVAIAASFTFITITYTPKYSSTAIMYIVRENKGDASSGDLSSDFSLALKVVNDCDYLLKSDSVLDEVKSTLNLGEEYDDLDKHITTNNPSNTRILEVSVEAETPEQAKTIADNLCRIGAEKINKAMGFDQVNLYQLGNIDTNPSNETSIFAYALIGVIAAIVTYLVYLIRFIVDDTIRTEEDVQRYLGLSILGEIPDADETNKKRYGYYRRGYGRRYYRSAYGPYGRTPTADSTNSKGGEENV